MTDGQELAKHLVVRCALCGTSFAASITLLPHQIQHLCNAAQCAGETGYAPLVCHLPAQVLRQRFINGAERNQLQSWEILMSSSRSSVSGRRNKREPGPLAPNPPAIVCCCIGRTMPFVACAW